MPCVQWPVSHGVAGLDHLHPVSVRWPHPVAVSGRLSMYRADAGVWLQSTVQRQVGRGELRNVQLWPDDVRLGRHQRGPLQVAATQRRYALRHLGPCQRPHLRVRQVHVRGLHVFHVLRPSPDAVSHLWPDSLQLPDHVLGAEADNGGHAAAACSSRWESQHRPSHGSLAKAVRLGRLLGEIVS